MRDKAQIKLNVVSIADLSDEAIWTRIQTAWWLAKEDVAISKFGPLLEAQLVNQGLQPPKCYRDDKVAWEFVDILAAHFRAMFSEISILRHHGHRNIALRTSSGFNLEMETHESKKGQR